MTEKHKGRASNQAVKLMIIRDYLYSHTNETHCATSADIIKHLESKGIRADRKTIFSDIERLRSDYGMDIVRGRGYRVAEPIFKPSELRLMIDSVQSAKFITEKQAGALTTKIKNLADIYTRPSLDRKAYVSERIQDMKESIVSSTDAIHEAISTDYKLQFKYCHYSPSAKNKKRYSKNGSPYEVSPFALYWNNGNYYLYAFDSEKSEFRFFRIDRMEDMIISSERREGHNEFQEKTLIGNRKAKVFDMYGGEKKNVLLRAHNSVADAVIDAFGDKVMLVPLDEEWFSVNVPVEISPTFFAWLTNFGERVQITNPPEVVEEMRSFIQKISEMY